MEGLGVVWVVTMLRPYIEGAKLLIRCDHRNMRWIRTTTSCTNNRLIRWRLRLAKFDHDVEYKSGQCHVVADAMSRITTDGEHQHLIPEKIPLVGVTTRSGAVLDSRRPENVGTVPVPVAELVQTQEADGFFSGIRKRLDRPEATRFFVNADGVLSSRTH